MDKPEHAIIYDHGEGYLHSAKKLQRGLSHPPDPEKGEQFHVITSGLVAVHALELFFRALHHMHNDGEAPDDHDLRDLFQSLPEETREQLRNKYEEHLDEDVIERFEEKTETTVNEGFDGGMEECLQIFTQVRQIHKRQNPIPMPVLFTMIQAVKKTYKHNATEI